MILASRKYIYFAGDNLIGTKYYRRAIIVGETTDLVHRQHMYTPGKGMIMPKTGDLVSYAGLKNLPWPFMDYFEAPAGMSDKDLHELFTSIRPFKDFVYNRLRERCHPLGWRMRAAEVILDS